MQASERARASIVHRTDSFIHLCYKKTDIKLEKEIQMRKMRNDFA